MIARFVDGPLMGSDREYREEVSSIDLYCAPDDPHAIMRYVAYGHEVERNGKWYRLFRVEHLREDNPWSVGKFDLNTLNLTPEDRALLKGMKVGL